MSRFVKLLTASHRLTVAISAIALAALLAPPASFSAQEGPPPGGDLVLLLSGVYVPVLDGPDLGLSQVDLGDGSFVKTKIYRVSGLPGTDEGCRNVLRQLP